MCYRKIPTKTTKAFTNSVRKVVEEFEKPLKKKVSNENKSAKQKILPKGQM